MKGEYKTAQANEAQATFVDPGDGRQFLVVQFLFQKWQTLVFEREPFPECWVSRRSIDANTDPVGAVTGHLLASRDPDPVTQMKRDLERERRSNWELRNELMRLKAGAKAPVGAKKRGGGKRGRRNP